MTAIEIDVTVNKPSIDVLDTVDYDGVTYYIDTTNNYVYQIVDDDDDDIGIILGVYLPTENKVNFITS